MNEEMVNKLGAMDERMRKYEDFTKKFLDALPEELGQLGREILKRRLKEDET